MMKPLFLSLSAVLSVLCTGHSFAQSGAERVIARVGDEKITLAQVQAELAPGAANDLGAQKAALQAMITRKLLAQEALRQKLDKTPVGAMVIKRSEETAVVSVLERNLVGTAPPVIGDEQVRAFIADHPMMFASRRLLTLNQFVTDDGNPALVKKLEAANTMDDFQATLMQNGVSFRRAAVVVDTLRIDPRIAVQLVKFKPGDVFITPRGRGYELSGVVDNSTAPIVGVQAETVARALLARQEVSAKLGGEIQKIVKAGEPEVQFNDDYAPKKAK